MSKGADNYEKIIHTGATNSIFSLKYGATYDKTFLTLMSGGMFVYGA